MLVGKGVVMGLLLVLGRVPLAPFWISFCSCFSILPGLLVRCLLVLFLYDIVLHGLLREPLLGLCLLLGWLLLRFRLLRLVRLRLSDVLLILLVFLVRTGNEFD